MLKELGYEPLASGFAPGDLGRMIEDSLLDAGIGCEFIFVAGETRTNITILDRATHRDTVLAAAGPKVTQHAISLLRARLNRRLRPHGQSWLVLAGSIPPGCDPALYADLLGMAAERGAYSAVDADGEVVAAILSGGAAPDLLKLNEHEAGRLLGRTIEDEASAIEAARTLRAWGLEQVVITRGGGGAVAMTPEGGSASARSMSRCVRRWSRRRLPRRADLRPRAQPRLGCGPDDRDRRRRCDLPGAGHGHGTRGRCAPPGDARARREIARAGSASGARLTPGARPPAPGLR